MTDIVDIDSYDNVPQYEVATPVLGGTDQPMNVPLKALANRTKHLKAVTDSLSTSKISTTVIGANSGVCPLDSGGKVPAANLPSYVDDVLEYANFAALPGTGSSGIIYIAQDTNIQYRWSGSAYVQLVASPGTTDAVTEGSTNLYFTAARVRAVVLTGLSLATNAAITATDTVLQAFGKLQKQITDHLADTANPHSVTKAQVGLGNCDNTSDANKPVSTAQAAADALALPKAGGTMTGDITMGANKIINAIFQRFKDKKAAPAISSGVLALDMDNGVHAVDLNANITSITIANIDATTVIEQATIVRFKADGTARSITWPSGDGTSTLLVKFPSGGTAPTPTSTSGKYDTIVLVAISQYLVHAFVRGQNQ